MANDFGFVKVEDTDIGFIPDTGQENLGFIKEDMPKISMEPDNLDFEQKIKNEKAQKEQQDRLNFLMQRKQEAQEADPRNWTYEQTKDYFKKIPVKTPEEEAQRQYFLDQKKQNLNEMKDKLAQADQIKVLEANERLRQYIEPGIYEDISLGRPPTSKEHAHMQALVRRKEWDNMPQSVKSDLILNKVAEKGVPFLVTSPAAPIFWPWMVGYEALQQVKNVGVPLVTGEGAVGYSPLHDRTVRETLDPLFEKIPEKTKKIPDPPKWMMAADPSGYLLYKTAQWTMENPRQTAVIGATAGEIMLDYLIVKQGLRGTQELKNAFSPELRNDFAKLGLSPNATTQEIHDRYRDLSLQFHPDRVAPELKAQAEAKFKDLSNAYTKIKASRVGALDKFIDFFRKPAKEAVKVLGSEAGAARIPDPGEVVKLGEDLGKLVKIEDGKAFVTIAGKQIITDLANLETPKVEEVNIKKFADENKDRILKEYAEKKGNVVSTDAMKTFFEPVGYTGIDSKPYQKVAGSLAKEYFDKLIDTNKGTGKEVVLMTGGTGTGKTSFIKGFSDDPNKAAIFDLNMTNLEQNSKLIQDVLDKGLKPKIVYILRDPKQAFWEGVHARAINPESEDYRRVVDINNHMEVHEKVRDTFSKLVDKFGDKINYEIIDNRGKIEDAKNLTLDEFNKIRYSYNGIKKELENEIRQRTGTAKEITQAFLSTGRGQEGVVNEPIKEEFPGIQAKEVEQSYQKLSPEDQANLDLQIDELRRTPEGNLFIAIKKLGGIAPYESTGAKAGTKFMAEELRDIPNYLKNKNSTYQLDTIVEGLKDYGWNFEDSTELLNAIKDQAANPITKVNRTELKNVIRQAAKNQTLQQKLYEGATKRRKFINTVKSAEKTTPEVALNIESRYTPISNAETLKQAQEYVASNYNDAVQLVEGPTKADTFSNAVAITLIDKAQTEGRFSDAIRIVERTAEKNTELGQAIQALSMYERLSPEGILKYANKVIQQSRANITQKDRVPYFEKRIKDITSETERVALAKKLGIPYLSPTEAAELYDMATKIQGMVPGKEKNIEIALLLKKISDKIPVTLGRKISMVQTMAQLLNPKTIIRNILGNGGFMFIENLSDVVGTALDIATATITKKRTTYLPSISTQAKGFTKGLKEGTQEAVLGINLKQMGQKFDLPRNGVFDKGVMGALEKTLGVALKAPDQAAYQAAFDQSMRNQMLASEETDPTAEMIEIAHLEGLYRTFQDDNVISNLFVNLKRTLNLHKDFGMGDIVLKYPKTPANLLARGIEYSPLGVVNFIYQLVKPALKHGPFDQRTFVKATSRAFTGSTLLAGAGVLLAALGIITGKGSKDKDVKALKEQVGLRDYQLNISALKRFVMSGLDPDMAKIREDDILINYDWFLPTSIPVALGANIVINREKSIVDNAVNMGERLATASETLAEQPVVTGVKTMMSKQSISEGIAETFKGIPSSFIPTLLNQIKQLTDNVSRNTSDPNYFKEAYNKAIVKIPGASKTLEPKTTTLGEPKEMYQLGSNNPFNVFLNPAFVNRYKPDAISKMVLDIWETTGETVHFPRVAQGKIKMGPEQIELNPEQYTEYQKYLGTRTNILFTALSQNSRFLNLPDDEKAKKLQGYLTDINTAAKIEILGYRPKRVSHDVITIIKEIGNDKIQIDKNTTDDDLGFVPEDLGFVSE